MGVQCLKQFAATLGDLMGAVGGQLLALATFFAFPAIQYLLLRRFSVREGAPELWFLPEHNCFRLVIRNIPGKKILSGLKTRAMLRKIVRPVESTGVAAFMDEVLVKGEDFFLFPGTDQTLVSFRLERGASDSMYFVFSDKLGKEKKRFPLDDFDKLVCDYTANLENPFNFDIKMGKRAEVTSESLVKIFAQISDHRIKQDTRFPLDIRDVH